jgi:parallel beta-helix repeat protein
MYLCKVFLLKMPIRLHHTIIDGGGNGTVVKFESGETEEAMLYGFTITNGDAGRTGNGGGIRITNFSEPIIKSNVIKQNSASYGAGIFVSNESKPTILMNTVTENTATGSRGAGIYVINQSHAIIKDNVFSEHEGVVGVIHIGGANAGHKSSADITGNYYQKQQQHQWGRRY